MEKEILKVVRLGDFPSFAGVFIEKMVSLSGMLKQKYNLKLLTIRH